MIESGRFGDKKVLLIDKQLKNKNDRTWCFWEEEPGTFESIVFRKWAHLTIAGENVSHTFRIDPYQYKMIRGIDFYEYCLARIKKNENFQIVTGEIDKIDQDDKTAFVSVNGKEYKAQFVFNSLLQEQPPERNRFYYLLQHFKGWRIRTSENVFDPHSATLMDFRIDQQPGTTFLYVMPFSQNEALVEYTVFSNQPLNDEEYNNGLRNYIKAFITPGDFQILEEEFGIIPMTNNRFNAHNGRIINIGTAGGQTKGSSGYTFRFIQKHSAEIVDSIIKTGSPLLKGKPASRFRFYDSTLLNILHHRKYPGSEIFLTLFQRNRPQDVLRFLDNETNLFQELQIISTLPKRIFLKAGLQEIIRSKP